MTLEGRVVIVTGAGGGIGLATCLELRAAGASVVASDYQAAGVDEAVRRMSERRSDGAGATVAGVPADVSAEADVARLVQSTLDRFARIDALVHAAGILRPRGTRPKPLAEVPPDEWDQVLNTNLRGTFLVNRAVLPVMMRQRSGQIVNISSTSGRQGRALDAPYCASKFGVVGLTQSLAEEVRSFGIKVHLLMPGAVATPLWEQNKPLPMPDATLPPERVAALIRYVLELPDDTILENLVVAPWKARRGKTSAARQERGTAPTEATDADRTTGAHDDSDVPRGGGADRRPR